jgi:predicted DCC family thiol-disulfide oxidoreductase YuxK
MMFIRDYGTPHATTFERSEAWIEVLRELGGAWSVVSGLRLIPRRVRDLVYDLVARNRYAWFGSYRECRIPSPEQRSRFLP